MYDGKKKIIIKMNHLIYILNTHLLMSYGHKHDGGQLFRRYLYYINRKDKNNAMRPKPY